MFKKILFFMVFFVLSLYGKDILNFATSQNVGPLNPHLYSPNQMYAQDMVYEGFVKFENGKIIPVLATSWQISDDGKKYIFNLRKNVKFSNNDEFDAFVVEKNFDAIMQNKDMHSWLELANIIKSYKALDKFSFEIELTHPYEQTLKELCLVRPFRFISISSFKNGGTKDGIIKAIGTGAYKLVQSQNGVGDKFEINENYWGEKPKIKEIQTKIIPDKNAKIVALKTGDIDLIYGNDEIDLQNFQELKKEFNYSLSKPSTTLALVLNSSKFPTNELAVREAISYAINKKDICKNIFLQDEWANFLFEDEQNLKDAKIFNYDKNLAKQILEKNGWKLKDGFFYKNNKILEVEILYYTDDIIFRNLAQILKYQLQDCGIKTNIKTTQESLYYKRQKNGDFSIVFANTWAQPYGSTQYLSSMRVKSHADFMAQSGLKIKPQIDENITKMLTSTDENKSKFLKEEVIKSLQNEAIYIPIIYERKRAIFSKKLNNFQASGDEFHIPFEKMSFND